MAEDHTGRCRKSVIRAPPGERESRRARCRERADAPRPENELDGAGGARIEHAHARVAPALEGAAARVARGDTTGGDGQSRAARLYPLGTGTRRARLPAQDHHVVDQPRRPARQQFPFGRGVEIAGQQQRMSAGDDSEYAVGAAARDEHLEPHAIPFETRIAAGRGSQPVRRPAAPGDDTTHAALER